MSNNTLSTPEKSKLDGLKWVLFYVVLIGAVVGNQYYASFSFLYRLAALLVAALFAGLLFFSTATGKKTKVFFKDAFLEMRKVVWPNRQDTTRSTIMILIMVFIVGVMLWLMDYVVLYFIGIVTGLGSA